MQEEYSGAIYIIGPDNEDSYEKTLKFLNAKFNKVIVIGDGKNDLLNENGEGSLEGLITLSQDHPNFINEGKILVYIEAHGIVADNKHAIIINKEGSLLSSRILFKILVENIKSSIDIIFVPCHGKAALKDIETLPLNSRVIIFSDVDQDSYVINILDTLDHLLNHKFTFDIFYNNYLAHMFLVDESPTISIVGKETIDPIILSESYFGSSISEDSRQYVHDHFSQIACNNNIYCHDKIDYLMNKIEQSSSIDNFRGTISENYFKAFNEYTQIKVEYEFSRNNKHDKIVSYHYQEPEFCYIEALELKNKIDQLLLEYEIPLELDLLDKFWHEINYEYNSEDEGSERLSDLGIYHFIKHDGFIENDNFTKPEYGEYGLVLGIIKDIHLSLSPEGFLSQSSA
ncbi:MAG: hypothetical protein WBJ81_01565 [Rickettsiales bacterium]